MKEISKAVALAQRTQVAVPAHMAPALVRRDPDTNLALAISRLHELGCDAFVKKGMVFPTNPKTGEMTWREVVRGTELVLGKRNDLPACAREVAALLAPAHMDSIEGWLTEVSAITARRSETEEEGALTLVAYSSRLAQYPGDIVWQTLQAWSGKWFPTWGELKEILDARVAPRLAVRNALLGLTPQKEGRALPSAFESMGPEAQAQWLRKEAEWAIRRSDPDWAAELIERAEEIEDGVRERMQEQGA